MICIPKTSSRLLAALAVAAGLSAPLGAQSALVGDLDIETVNDTLGLSTSTMFPLEVTGAPGEPIVATVLLDGVPFTLDLAPWSTRSATDYKLLVQGADGALVETTPGPVRTLRGIVQEIPGSVVAASYDETGGLYARIQIDGEPSDFWVEQVAMSIPGALPEVHVSYRGSSVAASSSRCGIKALPGGGIGGGGGAGAGQIALGSGCGAGLCVAELGCDSDVEYYQDYGSSVTNVENRINAIVNALNTQYMNQAGIRHDITSIVVRTSEPDPYSGNDISGLLSQLRSQWLGPLSSTPHDVAQLFTGRNISGGTIGLAYLGSVCTSQRYSVVENFTNSFGCLTDLSAHELGHNWGAGHCNCSNFTMNPFITCANQFTSGSLAAILGTKNTANCLTPDGPPTASFNALFTSGPAPHTASFQNNSSGLVTSWLWDFGDGATSTQMSPSHTYTVPGLYTVSLTATGPQGVDTLTMPDLIDVGPPLVPFVDLGGGTSGQLFTPKLTATGSLQPGTNLNINLATAPPSALTLVWLAFSSAPVPAFGGTLFPNPPVQQLFFTANFFGQVSINTTWPAGVPAGLDIYLQYLVQDATVPDGVTLSNGIHGVTP